MLSGNDMLALIERMLDDSRRELASVDTQLERTSAELAHLRQAELGVLSVLARVRLREIESGELAEALGDTGRRVTEILGLRADAHAALGGEITAAEAGLAKLGQERASQHAVVETAEKAVDAAEAEAQQALAADAAYRELLQKAEASDGVADLAESKAKEAHTDRAEKGKPYEVDPLFSYLWARGFGTSRYAAGPLTRLLDGWVARVGNFEPLRRDYWMLSELPARLDEHAQRMRVVADSDVGAVRASELEAAEAAGAPARGRDLDAAEESLASIDRVIEEKEAEIAALVEKRAAFAAGEDEHSRQCTQLLADALRREKMKALRERATRTENPDDDKAVDELTVIRAETPRLEDEVARYRKLHDTHRDRGAKLEEIRKRFKEHRYDAVSSEFVNSALIATLLSQLLAGALGVPDIWDAIRKQQRYRNMSADPGFGSGHFPRAPGRGPWRMPGGGGLPRGGGFRTGGGFGRGGGFKTGGGF